MRRGILEPARTIAELCFVAGMAIVFWVVAVPVSVLISLFSEMPRHTKYRESAR